MPRGESDKSAPRSGSAGVFAAFGVAVLAVLTLVVFSVRSCGPDEPVAAAEPFAGAASVFSELRWRSCDYDPAEVRARVAARGYRRVGEAREVELPFDGPIDALADRCGVVVVSAPTSTVLSGVAVGDEPERAPCAAPSEALGTCGAGPLHLRGTGQVTLEAHALDGLTPSDARRVGVAPDLLLAQAEAERLMARHGYHPRGRALRVELARGVATFEPPVPSDGCVVWAVTASGLGSPQSLWGGEILSADASRRRSLVGAASCAGGEVGAVRFVDPGSGGVIVAVPYEAGDGPQVGGGPSGPSRIGALEVVTDPASLGLP